MSHRRYEKEFTCYALFGPKDPSTFYCYAKYPYQAAEYFWAHMPYTKYLETKAILVFADHENWIFLVDRNPTREDRLAFLYHWEDYLQ